MSAFDSSPKVDSEQLCLSSLREVSELIHARQISSVQLVEATLARIDALDSQLHSLITIDVDAMRREAKEADRNLAEGRDHGPLHGIPISVKDQFATNGLRTTLASKPFAAFIPDYDAAVVERVRAAGAVIAGKANMYELGTGWGTFGHFPVAVNPWNSTHSPGGSSSGSAVGVAAGLAFASLTSDGGGSTRVPANYCGVVGLKPTHGRVSYYGSIPDTAPVRGKRLPVAKTISAAGVIARTVGDVALVFDAIAGWDSRDAGSEDVPATHASAAMTGDVSTITVGVPWSYIEEGANEENLEAFRAALDVLRDAGATVETINSPAGLSDIGWMWTTIAYVEMAALFGDIYAETPDGFGPELQDRIEAGWAITSVEYFMATQARAQLRSEWLQLFAACDVVATPSAPAEPPTMAELVSRRSDLQDVGDLARFTRPYNMTGLPAVSVPDGFTSLGLPLGLQIGGRPFDESTVLGVADAYERRTKWHTCRPPVGGAVSLEQV